MQLVIIDTPFDFMFIQHKKCAPFKKVG